MATPAASSLSCATLGALIQGLLDQGYTVVGPRLRDEAVVPAALKSADELPSGWSDEQGPGAYRLRRRRDAARFQTAATASSWKRLLFSPRRMLWCARCRGDAWEFEEDGEENSLEAPGAQAWADAATQKLALLGVHPCDLAGIAIQDRVFLGGKHVDPHYAKRREELFIVVAQCTQAAATCFCASMGTGPRAEAGFDVALTELLDGDEPRFIAETGSERGAAFLANLKPGPASKADIEAARGATQRAAAQQGRRLQQAEELRELLLRQQENARWDDVAQRCLACGNCTFVCPTCFCSTVEDRISLDGRRAERWRKWDSCFGIEHSYLHGGSVRPSIRARYRQWLTHKLATWIDQFGTSGCVGCGRCITWCPVGIDLTEETRAIRESEHGKNHSRSSR